MQFHETPAGTKFLNADFPSLIDQLKRIADALEEFTTPIEDDELLGHFEKVTKEDQSALDKMKKDYDTWFDTLATNFNLASFGLDLRSLKNLIRHAWNANKDI